MPRLRDNLEELSALVGRTSNALGLPMNFVEKDFWITELLRSVTKPIEYAVPIFKGGTSLSKAFGLIDRFSEDVDVLVFITRARSKEFGVGSIDGILREICDRGGRDLSIGPERQLPVQSSKGEHRSVRYVYPARTAAVTTQDGVLLEAGIRGVSEPRQSRTIRSYVSDYAISQLNLPETEYDELAPFTVEVLNPERTLVEKLSLLHDLGSRYPATSDKLNNAGRHYYDIFKLLSDERLVSLLKGRDGLVAEMAAESEANSRKWGWPFTPRPKSGFAASAAFDPGHACQERIQSAYAATASLIYREVPSLEQCISLVRLNASIL